MKLFPKLKPGQSIVVDGRKIVVQKIAGSRVWLGVEGADEAYADRRPVYDDKQVFLQTA